MLVFKTIMFFVVFIVLVFGSMFIFMSTFQKTNTRDVHKQQMAASGQAVSGQVVSGQTSDGR